MYLCDNDQYREGEFLVCRTRMSGISCRSIVRSRSQDSPNTVGTLNPPTRLWRYDDDDDIGGEHKQQIYKHMCEECPVCLHMGINWQTCQPEVEKCILRSWEIEAGTWEYSCLMWDNAWNLGVPGWSCKVRPGSCEAGAWEVWKCLEPGRPRWEMEASTWEEGGETWESKKIRYLKAGCPMWKL